MQAVSTIKDNAYVPEKFFLNSMCGHTDRQLHLLPDLNAGNETKHTCVGCDADRQRSFKKKWNLPYVPLHLAPYQHDDLLYKCSKQGQYYNSCHSRFKSSRRLLVGGCIKSLDRKMESRPATVVLLQPVSVQRKKVGRTSQKVGRTSQKAALQQSRNCGGVPKIINNLYKGYKQHSTQGSPEISDR